MDRMLEFLRTRDLPQLTRPNYVAELRQMSLWGIVIGSIESSMASVVASKTFSASALLTTVVFATPVLAYLLNIMWGVVIRGRRRVHVFVVLGSGALLVVGSIALTPAVWKPWGGYIFAVQVGLAHVFMSGLVTLRTTMWKANYPQTHRAQIAGRLYTVSIMLSLLTTAVLSALFDRNPEYYRFVYPLVALLGFVSLGFVGRMHVRGEKGEARRFRARVAANQTGVGRLGLVTGLQEVVGIMWRDRYFGKYMLAQFLLGSANFFTDPVLVTVFTKQLDFRYFSSTLMLYQIPIVMVLLSIRYWARLFDRVGVLRFRVYNSAAWAASYVCVTLGVATLDLSGGALMGPAVAILVLGRILNGLGRGGGDIAWNLGHLHFAREHQTELYMSIHVALTGLRGLTMPVLGWVAHRYLGWASFGIALALATAAVVLFHRMAVADGGGGPGSAVRRPEPSSSETGLS
jgi:hypothetical protein